MISPVSTAKSALVAGRTVLPEHCKLHSVHYTLQLYTSYDTMNTAHCTPHIYIGFFKLITFHCKHTKFEWVELGKVYLDIKKNMSVIGVLNIFFGSYI